MSTAPLPSDDEVILAEFVEESEASLASLEPLFLKVEKNPADLEAVHAIFRPIHSIKGNSAFLGLMKTKQLAHQAETLLDAMRKKQLHPSAALINVLLAAVDELRAVMQRLRRKGNEIENPAAYEALLKRVTGAAAGEPAAASPPAPASSAAPAPAREAPAPEAEGPALIRVEEERLNDLAAISEELRVIAADLGQLAGGLAPQADQATQALLATLNGRLDGALARLQEGLLTIRKVPLRAVLQKAPRIVRDACAATGKQVALTITGDSIAVSRRVAQALDAPLLHLLRNAVDHGAELPADRLKLGKPAECAIRIEAIRMPGGVVIKLTDDGRGLDGRALLLAAVRNGAIPPGKKLTPAEMVQLIFLPGLSTARAVSDLSGRGVGMDVVRSSIEAVGGTLEVSSKPGAGTQFLLVMPE